LRTISPPRRPDSPVKRPGGRDLVAAATTSGIIGLALGIAGVALPLLAL
jgi:hypothetical protein